MDKNDLIKLCDIHSSHNTRNPVPNLTAEGLVSSPLHPGEQPEALEFMRNLVFGDNPNPAEYVRLIDTFEGNGLDSIRSLAEGGRGLPGICEVQLQPACLTSYRIAQTDEFGKRIVRYRVVYGERRILAMAYLYAKTGDEKFASIQALVVRADVKEANRRGLAENFLRRNPSPSEVAFTYKGLSDEGMKLADIAEMFFANDPRKTQGAAYQEIRSMLKLVKGKNKLTPERLAALDRGDIGLTKAKREADGHEPAEGKKYNRRRLVGLVGAMKLLDDAVMALDNNPDNDTQAGIEGYIEACADFMQYETPEAAKADSRERRRQAA